jgi:hypothetical protein
MKHDHHSLRYNERLMKRIAFGLAVILVSSLTALSQQQSPVSASAQAGPLEQLIENLTNEVRNLRLSLERWHAEDGTRLVMLERYRVQHEIAAATGDRLDAVRSELADVQIEVTKAQEQLRVAEERLRTNTDTQQQQTLEAAVKDVREGLGQLQARETRISSRERQLVGDADEQNRKLQTLDQLLETFAKSSVQR